MKTLILISALLLTPATSWAAGQFKCDSIDDNEPYGIEQIDLNVKSGSEISITLEASKKVTEKYVLSPDYVPRSRSMKGYLKFNVVDPQYDAYGEGPVTPIFVYETILSGENMKFIKTAGHGYSWAFYRCVALAR